MGTMVPFCRRPEAAAAKTEAILFKIGALYQQKLKAKEELPRVLAHLLQRGKKDLVLRAVLLWGSGEMEPHEILVMLEEASR